jgi:Ca2+-transporting ATPase
MTVSEVWLPSEEAGRGLGAPVDSPGAAAELRALLTTAVLCNNATLGADSRQDSGDPMELALLCAGRSAGLDRERLLQDRPLVRTHAFDAATRMMATVHDSGRHRLVAAKGAPEAILASSVREARATGDVAMSDDARKHWTRRIETLGRQGLRVLACAIQNGTDQEEGPFEGLTFQGLIGLEDPARADVPASIGTCRRAGIRVVMVTGDHAVTARSIGHAVGLDSARTVEGHHLEAGGASDGALLHSDIFARVSPEQKLALVRAYQAAGETVAMTGDGVNDAPALRQADIGVAMGQRGTDVARQAAAMILLDDAFPTIVRAIREGRVIFGNIRRFAAFLLSCNLSEVLVVGVAVIGTLPLPILPLQILYLNLVTDVFPAFALAMGEGDRAVMQRPPRPPKEPVLGRAQWMAIVLQSLALTAGTFASLVAARHWLDLDQPSTVTVTFLTLAFAQLWHVFNMRHAESRPMVNEIVRSPWIWASLLLCAALLVVPAYPPALAAVLHLVPPSRDMWVVVLACSLAPLFIIQAAMLARQASRRRAATTAARRSAGHG